MAETLHVVALPGRPPGILAAQPPELHCATASLAVGRRGRVRLPWSMAFLFKVIKDSLGGTGRYIEIEDHIQDLGEAFRSDAKAEGDLVIVGGWECLGGRRPGEARWYSEKLDRKSALI